MPEVSVVVATYNQGVWLAQAIESVRAQTFRDWELVVVDDGSTDGTHAVVAGYAADARVRYLFQPNQERAAARNRGLAASSAPFVAFLDADDCWLPAKLEKQLAVLEADPSAGLCYTPARFIDGAGRPLAIRKPPLAVAGDVFGPLMRGNLIILASVLVRRACLDAVGGFDTSLPGYGFCEDWDLWLRIARRYRVTVVDEELTLYRKHAANTRWDRVLESALLVIDKWYADPETERRAGISRATARALHYWTNATSLALEQRSAAIPLVIRALRESPATALGRRAAAAFATLLLPRVAVRALKRLSI